MLAVETLLARDGVHFNCGGVARIGSLFVDTVSGMIRGLVKHPCVQVVAAPTVGVWRGVRGWEQGYQC